MSVTMEWVLGALLAFMAPFMGVWLFRRATIEVDDGEAAVVTEFGRLVATLREPGLHVYPTPLLPWVRVKKVSLRRDFRLIERVPVNDARGTSLLVDLWVEFRVVAPEKSLFAVADWGASLENLVSHAATAILGDRDFWEILAVRTDLGQRLVEEIAPETTRWGIQVEFVFIQNVSLLPEVSRIIFESVGARLRQAKADIDEAGRIRIAKLEAATQARVAELVARAKGEYPMAVGRGFAKLKERPEVLKAYQDLHELALLRPHRTVAFRGFAAGEVRAMDAAMVEATHDVAQRNEG